MDSTQYLEQAIHLAEENVKKGGGPFGAVIVRNGEIISEGANSVTLTNDPTAHAEVVAIRTACQKLNTFSLEGCVLYSSCEPCPMCMASSLWARVDKVFFAADRYQAAQVGFDDLAFYDLFEKTPRDQWKTPVEHLNIKDALSPFNEWNAKTDKVEY
ncbi:MAG: nucleoside deaminase [Micrococcaceae bacterium]